MQIICGNCGQQIEIEETGQAASVRCPSCSHEIPLTDSHSNGLNEDAGFASRARRLLSEAIQIECDSCSLCLKVAKKMAGRRIRCPGCGFMINVPTEILDPEAFEELKPADELEAELASIAQAANSPASGDKPHPHKPFKKPGMGAMPWIMLLIAAALIGGIVYGLHAMKSKPATTTATNTLTENSNAPAAAMTPTSKALLQLLSCSWRTFANPAGYFPAAPGRLYACIELQANTADAPLEFHFDGTGAFIESNGTRYYALGRELNASAAIPAEVDKVPLKIQPHTTTDAIRLIFDLPAVEFRGRLEVKGCNDLLVSLPAPPKPSASLEGNYAEKPPRNLKPMLRDPILREFQLNDGQTLYASQLNEKVFSVKFPQAKVSGTAELQNDRTFAMTLSHTLYGTLSCKALLTEDGRTLILFLGDKPMHQMVFQKQPAGE